MNVLLGVTGSVAAKLTPKMVEALKEAGHKVKLVYTQAAVQFLPYVDEISFDDKNWQQLYNLKNLDVDGRIVHIELADWADVILIAPLTANTLAKLANGICDNLLTSIVRAMGRKSDKRLILAPAMNTNMWLNPFTFSQLCTLRDVYAAKFVRPQEKELACGKKGIGAMADIEDIVASI